MATVKLVMPRRCNEFRVTFRGQHRPQRPVLEITNSRHGWEMFATYDPYMGISYDPNRWFIAMPYGIKMNEIRNVMRYVASDVVAVIDAKSSACKLTDIGLVIANQNLNAAVLEAIGMYVKDYCNV